MATKRFAHLVASGATKAKAAAAPPKSRARKQAVRPYDFSHLAGVSRAEAKPTIIDAAEVQAAWSHAMQKAAGSAKRTESKPNDRASTVRRNIFAKLITSIGDA